MPAPVSKRQLRYMHAIMNSDRGTSKRGDRAPKSVASQYADHDVKEENLPEDKGKAMEGGLWTDKHHKRAAAKKKDGDKSKKEKMRKAFSELYKGRGAGVIVMDKNGKILLGQRSDDKLWATPGGHVEEGESFEQGALRELKEEAGIVGYSPEEVWSGRAAGNDTKTFVVYQYDGKPKSNGELNKLKFTDVADLPWNKLRPEATNSIKALLDSKLKKTLKDMVALEQLEKNIIRDGKASGVVYEITHGDSLKLVGNGTFRFLRDQVRDMKDEDFKDVKIDTYTLSIRKHMNDVYSGRISDGHKIVHQFINRSLPALAAELMSVFEWYLPEDEPHLDGMIDDDIPDDAIYGSFHELMDNYKKHNLANIYDEMENIRSEIRNGMAVDLQQVEDKIMSLFDKLEECVHDIAAKHNKLAEEAGDEIDILENKLVQLQHKIDEMSKQPVTVEAYSSNPQRHSSLLESDYCYLSKPSIEISPNGSIKIMFNSDWHSMDQENFLKDMRAKVIRKSRG